MKKVLLGIGYGFLQLTGGVLMTFVGLLVSLFILIFMRKKANFHRNGYSWIIEIGGNGGGVNLGAVSLCGTYSKKDPRGFEHTRRHEFGHSIQNIIFGPLYLFVVAIPSVCRYGYNVYCDKKGINLTNSGYDCKAGFEYTASLGGTKIINKIENLDFPYEYEGCYCGGFSKNK